MTKFNYLDDNLVAFCLLPFILPSVGRRVASDPPEDDTNNDGSDFIPVLNYISLENITFVYDILF